MVRSVQGVKQMVANVGWKPLSIHREPHKISSERQLKLTLCDCSARHRRYVIIWIINTLGTNKLCLLSIIGQKGWNRSCCCIGLCSLLYGRLFCGPMAPESCETSYRWYRHAKFWSVSCNGVVSHATGRWGKLWLNQSFLHNYHNQSISYKKFVLVVLLVLYFL